MPNNFSSAQDLVDVKEIKDDVIVMKDGSLRQIIMVSGISFALKSQEEQDSLTQAYQDFLNSVNFPIQIVIHSRKINIGKYLKNLEERKAQEPSALLQDQIDEYIKYISDFVKDNAIMSKTFLVVVSYVGTSLSEASSGMLDSLPFFSKKKPEVQAKDSPEEKRFLENSKQLRQRAEQVAEGLGSVGLETAVLNTEQLIELFYNFYNPETIEREKVLK